MAKRNRIFRHCVSNVRTAPKHVDRKIAERKLALYGKVDNNDNQSRWDTIEALIQSEFRSLDRKTCL